jgi:hypothetical protein
MNGVILLSGLGKDTHDGAFQEARGPKASHGDAPARKKAQVSTELLFILVISMVIILVIAILGQQQMITVQKQKDSQDTQNSLLDLSAAAKEVYAQGEGSKRHIFIRLPGSYDPAGSFVANKSIQIRAAGTDHVALEDFNVRGNLPGASGGQWIWVISEGDRVRIGTSMLSLTRNSISLVMSPGEASSVPFYAQSLWDRNMTVRTAVTWTNPNVTAVLAVGTFSLAPNQSQPETMDFNAGMNALGLYSGSVAFNASDGNSSELVILPLTIQVLSYQVDQSPPMNVTPNYWVATMMPNDSLSRSFTVCTNSHTSLSSVAFTPTSGAPGSWVNGSTPPLGSMAAGTCQIKTMTIKVPGNATNGSYTGSIQVVGQGASGASAAISLSILIPSPGGENSPNCNWVLDNQSMCNCPPGSSYWDIPLCNCRVATIYVVNGTVHGGPDDGKPYNGTLLATGGFTVVGTTGPDIIISAGTGNYICGEAGDDIMYGGSSVDMLDGGPGNDIIYGDESNDLLYGKDGNDIIYGGNGGDQIDGGLGDDTIYGEAGDDTLYGGPGNDNIRGGGQADMICGNDGDDVLNGGDQNDVIDGGEGSNSINGEAGTNNCYRGTMVNCTSKSGWYQQCGPS